MKYADSKRFVSSSLLSSKCVRRPWRQHVCLLHKACPAMHAVLLIEEWPLQYVADEFKLGFRFNQIPGNSTRIVSIINTFIALFRHSGWPCTCKTGCWEHACKWWQVPPPTSPHVDIICRDWASMDKPAPLMY